MSAVETAVAPKADAPLPWFLQCPEKAARMLLDTQSFLVIDFEIDTSHGDFGHARYPANKMLLTCLKSVNSPVRCKRADELNQQELIRAVSRTKLVVCHNCKYELGWLKRMGVDLRDVLVWDTQLAEYVLLGNRAAGSEEHGMPPVSLGLDDVCTRRGLPPKEPAVETLIANGINPVSIPPEWLEERCKSDVISTFQVFYQQRREIAENDQAGVLLTRILFTPLVAEVEQEGMALDPVTVQEEYEKTARSAEALSEEMKGITNGANPRSPLQMAKFLYSPVKDGGLGFKELTSKWGDPLRNGATKAFPHGQPLTDKNTLDKLKATTAKQREFLRARKELGKAQALLSKNLEFFQGVVKEHGGVFYGEISQTSTATHRTSSRGVPLRFYTLPDSGEKGVLRAVQFQNIPRALKRVIKAKQGGWKIVDADAPQIEFRTAGVLSKDPQAIEDISNPDFDAHVFSASEIYAKTPAEVLAEKREAEADGRDSLRQKAKPHTYKPLYGGRKGTPAEERYYKAFRKRYEVITKTQAGWIDEVAETKKLVTPWKLVYYWPMARRDEGGYVNVQTAVSNYAIQGFATAEVMVIAAVYLWHLLRAYGLEHDVRIVNLVHDSIVLEVSPDVACDHQQTLTHVLKLAFTHWVYHYVRGVYGMEFGKIPLGVGIKTGEHWGEGKEQTWDIYADGKEVKRK